MNRLNVGIALCLITLAVALRIAPHPENFAPITAVALFGGAVLPRQMAVWVPLMAMMLSDLVIGWHDLVFITWGSYALIALVGSHWLQKLSVRRIFALGVGSSVFFFIVTNFAVWITSGMYAHTLAGLQQCFVMALPFFRNTLLSDVLYSGILFGLYELATKSYKSEVAKPA